MYKQLFCSNKALRFRRFQGKGWALFACLGRVVTIGVLSVSTLERASATSHSISETKVASVGDSLQADREASLDEVEIVGSRAPLALSQAPRMVTVLTRDDIQAAPVHSVNDLLKMVAGIDVRQRGPIGAQTDVGIRGSNSEQIAILLNGVNICDPQTGHNAVDVPCDVGDILRIEVLEGPAGRIYGTSSLVGAINIVTRKPTPQLRLRAEGGSFGYASLGASAAFASRLSSDRQLGTLLSASYTRSDGYSRSRAGSLNADYNGGKLYWQGNYQADSLRVQWHAGLSIKGFGSNTFYSARFDEQYERTAKLFTAVKAETSVGGLHLQPSVYWNRSYDRFELIRGSEDRVPFNHHRTDVFGIALNSYFDWLCGRTALGAEFRQEDIVSGNLGEPLSSPFHTYTVGLNRSNISLHAEHNVLLSWMTLSAGFVAVKNSWSEMPLTLYPGVDVSVPVGRGWKLYGSYNSSLRMPSFTELYYSVGGHKADKHLKPEELRAVEGGVKYSSHRLTAQASLYHNHTRNMIDWVMDTRDANAVWQSVNHTRINTFGQEVSARLLLPQLSGRPSAAGSMAVPTVLSVAYCHQHQSKVAESFLQSQYSLEYLRHKVTASVQARLVALLDLTLSYRYQQRVGTYTDTAGAVQTYHPYSLLDARLQWTADTYNIYIAANNITGHRYVDYGNVPQPGCWLTAGFSCRL